MQLLLCVSATPSLDMQNLLQPFLKAIVTPTQTQTMSEQGLHCVEEGLH